MDSWLTFSDFNAIYPDSGLTEPQFTQLAAEAVFSIMEATHWRARRGWCIWPKGWTPAGTA